MLPRAVTSKRMLTLIFVKCYHNTLRHICFTVEPSYLESSFRASVFIYGINVSSKTINLFDLYQTQRVPFNCTHTWCSSSPLMQ
jgi:hypothetical protein